MIHTNIRPGTMPADLPTNNRIPKPSHRFGLRGWFATDRGIAFSTMGLFAFLGAWFGAIVYFACWLAERTYTARSLVIALHVGAFVLIGSVTGAIKNLDSEAPIELRNEGSTQLPRPRDRHVPPAFLAWTALLMMSAGFWLFVLR